MTNWFIINISKLEVPNGFYEFYFGMMSDRVHYFSERKSSKIDFERLIHDHLAAELLHKNKPNYNLIFMVSSPVAVLENVTDAERSMTPFIHYLDQEIEKLYEFIGIKAQHVLLFDVDEQFEALAIRKEVTDKTANNIYDLDHQKKLEKDEANFYKLGKTWPPNLLTLLANNYRLSNLEYVLNTHPLIYFRLPIKNKNRTNLLHHLFSFIQLIVDEKMELNDTLLRKGRFQELDFNAKDIRLEIMDLGDQILASLNHLKNNNKRNQWNISFAITEENTTAIQGQLANVQMALSAWNPSTVQLNCSTAPKKLGEWKRSFNQFLKDVDGQAHDFLNFLENQAHVLMIKKEDRIQSVPEWEQEHTRLCHDRNANNQKIQFFVFDRKMAIDKLKKGVEAQFKVIEKDLDRCPDYPFMLLILLISLLFYALVIWTFANDLYLNHQYVFITMTAIYITVSIALFNFYKNKSIKSIKKTLNKISRLIAQEGEHFEHKLLQKKDNQQLLYELQVINQNIDNIEQNVVLKHELRNKEMTELEGKATDISTIGMQGGKSQNYRFKDNIKSLPNSLELYLKIYSNQQQDRVIEVLKNGTIQAKINLQSNKINALSKIKITTI